MIVTSYILAEADAYPVLGGPSRRSSWETRKRNTLCMRSCYARDLFSSLPPQRKNGRRVRGDMCLFRTIFPLSSTCTFSGYTAAGYSAVKPPMKGSGMEQSSAFLSRASSLVRKCRMAILRMLSSTPSSTLSPRLRRRKDRIGVPSHPGWIGLTRELP